jgi:hypothetical protein
MSDMTAALGDLSMQVKLGWAIWLAWGVVVLGWYRHARIPIPMGAAPAAGMPPAPFTDPQTFGGLAPDSMSSAGADFTEGSPAYTELNEYPDTEQR